MIVEFRNEKVSNHDSIPITIDCNVVAFIVFEGFHQPIKRTKQSVFLDVTVKWYWDRTHDMPAMVGYRNHWATAAHNKDSETVIEIEHLMCH
ncbi:hypothetical protein TNCV_4323031 [Trichonephila clavipes]|nr:hypothetical protein TNCV_4323031 [Trichonephila clavipes]